MPRFGSCWKDALKKLHLGCADLNDEVQGHLALDFANCFLEKTGIKKYPCSWEETISECLRNVDSHAFTAYTNFFTHTHSMCYFLQSQVWQEETEKTIYKLKDSSQLVNQRLEESGKVQLKLLDAQVKTAQYQEKLLKHGNELSKVLELSKDNVREVLSEFKSSTDEQRMLIMEVFDRVANLQSLLLGEFTGFYSMLFYLAAVCIGYLVTSTARTGNARFWIFVIISMNTAVERIIISLCVQEEHGQPVEEVTTTLYTRVWWCRKFFCTLAVSVLAYCSVKYRDYNLINNQLLVEIRAQNLELRTFMQAVRAQTGIENGLPSAVNHRNAVAVTQIPNGDVKMGNGSAYLSSTSSDEDYVPSKPTLETRKSKLPSTPKQFATHNYSLRERRSCTPQAEKVHSLPETPQQFASFVNDLANSSAQASRKLRSLVTKRSKLHFSCSSEDD